MRFSLIILLSLSVLCVVNDCDAMAWGISVVDNDGAGDGSDGDNGEDGVDGDPGTDGTDGENGTDGEFRGGNGGDGGNGGNGVDGPDADSDARGGFGGNGGNGGDACANFSLIEAESSITRQIRSDAGHGGVGGIGGLSVGLPNSVAGDGGDGGNASLNGSVANLLGSASIEFFALGGNGANGGFPLGSTPLVLGNGGDGGNASATGDVSSSVVGSASNPSNPRVSLSSIAIAFAGDGGSGFNAGLGGHGGVATAQATAFGAVNFTEVEARARSGEGGRGTIGGNGGDAFLENAVLGGAEGLVKFRQTAEAGNGGRGNQRGGFAGNARSTLLSDNINFNGGDAEVIVVASAGDGGNGNQFAQNGGHAFAEADVRDVGRVELEVSAGGGSGGNSNLGTSGQGGIGELGVVYSQSLTDSAYVTGTAAGGSGGFGERAGNGIDSFLDNKVDGDAINELRISQNAIGGNAGGTRGELFGVAGNARSTLSKEKSVQNLILETSARGGSGGTTGILNANGGFAEASTTGRNLTGHSYARSDAFATPGEVGGFANATSESTAIVDGTTSNATSFATGGGGTFGGNALGVATAIHEGSGDAVASVNSRGGAGEVRSDSGGFANAISRAIVLGENGTALATSTARGGSHRGWANTSSWAESATDAISSVVNVSGIGADGQGREDGLDGGDVFQANQSQGAAGRFLELQDFSQGGNGGGSQDGNGGNGGEVRLVYDQAVVNSRGGDTLLEIRSEGGDGGRATGMGNGGNGGDARTVVDITYSGTLSGGAGLNSEDALGGAGGSVAGIGNAGRGGNAYSDIRLISNGGGDVTASYFSASSGGGSTDSNSSGRAGDGGLAITNIVTKSNGGIATAVGSSRGGFGGTSRGSGASGNGGNAEARIVAETFSADAVAVATAFGGQAGSNRGSGPLVAVEGMAFSNSSAITTGMGLASARSIANGRGGHAKATALNSNVVFSRVLVETTSDVRGYTESISEVEFGGPLPFQNRFPIRGAAATIVAAPTPQELFFLAGNENILSAFEIGQTPDAELSDIFGAGILTASSSDETLGQSTSRAIDFSFDLDTRQTNDRRLMFGFYSAQLEPVGSFDELSLRIDVDGFDSMQFDFNNPTDASDFFTDRLIDFGELHTFDSLSARIRLDYTGSSPNGGFGFRFVFGNAGAISVPEPSGIALFVLVTSSLVTRRRRPNK